MSSIDVRTSGNLRFRARWCEPDGTARAKHFASHDEAVEYLHGIDQALHSGTYRRPRSGRTPIRTYARHWAGHRGVRPATRERNSYVVDKRIIPRFGRMHLDSLQPGDVQEWVEALTAEGLSAVTVRSYVRVLGSIMLSAKRDRLIDETPLLGVRLPRAERSSVPTWARLSRPERSISLPSPVPSPLPASPAAGASGEFPATELLFSPAAISAFICRSCGDAEPVSAT